MPYRLRPPAPPSELRRQFVPGGAPASPYPLGKTEAELEADLIRSMRLLMYPFRATLQPTWSCACSKIELRPVAYWTACRSPTRCWAGSATPTSTSTRASTRGLPLTWPPGQEAAFPLPEAVENLAARPGGGRAHVRIWPTPARIPEPAADGRRPVARVLSARPVAPLPVPIILRLAVVPLLPPGGAWPRRMRTMKIQPGTGLAGQAGARLCQEPHEAARSIGIRDCEQLALVPRPRRVLASSSA